MELIPITPAIENICCTGPYFLHHFNYNIWSHYQSLDLTTNLTLVHIPTFYLRQILPRSLFWSIRAIYPEDCLQMVIPRWENVCPHHIHACGVPWRMVYFPSWTLITSLFFRTYLGPHKKSSTAANLRFVQPYPGLCRVPLFEY